MKSGATYFVVVRTDIDNIKKVNRVIFTLKGVKTLTKRYPGDVTFEDGTFLIPLYQQDTIDLSGEHGKQVEVEGQVDFADKSVAKTERVKMFIDRTLATVVNTGNRPSSYSGGEIHMKFMDGVIVAEVENWKIDEAVARADKAIGNVEVAIGKTDVAIAKTERAISDAEFATRSAADAANKANLILPTVVDRAKRAENAAIAAETATTNAQNATTDAINATSDARKAIADTEDVIDDANAAISGAEKLDINATQDDDGATISVTRRTGTKTVVVKDGKDGNPGSNIYIDGEAPTIKVLEPSDIVPYLIQIRDALQGGDIPTAIAVLDRAILDLSRLG